MLTTEKTASKKWCPFSRVVSMDGHGETAANRWPSDSDAKASTTNCCIGSRCMAWRWERKKSDFGYCGVAGKVKP